MRVTRIKQVVYLVAAIAVVVGIALQSSHYVFANWNEKQAMIKPAYVKARGWHNAIDVRSTDMPLDADRSRFTRVNSAYLKLESLNPNNDGGEATTPVQEVPVTNTFPSSAEDHHHEIDVPVSSVSESESVTSGEDVVPQSTPNVPPDDSEGVTPDSPEAAPTPDTPSEIPEVPSSSATTTSTLWRELFANGAQSLAENLWGTLLPIAYASTTSAESTEEHIFFGEVEDVSLCSLAGTECYTVEVAGFDPGEPLKDKIFVSAAFGFSFASAPPPESVRDDKLVVRYYHDQKWRLLGEMYLNKEYSNAANGGYFTNALPEVESFEDMRDLRVVVEYVRADTGRAVEAYLDGVWLDVIYKERPQDITDEEIVEAVTAVPHNILETLRAQVPIADPEPVPADGISIAFPFASSLKNALVVRAHQASYSRSGEPLYVSITNTSESDESFRLLMALPQGMGTLESAAQYMRNVPKKSEKPVLSDVTYFCEAGWSGSASSTHAEYTCADTLESYTCSSLSDEGTNCLVQGVVVAAEEDVQYENAWVERTVTDFAGGAQARPKEGYVITSSLEESITLFAGQTVYFRLVVRSPGEGALAFQLLAEGKEAKGAIDSDLLQEESELKSSQKDAKRESLAQKKGVTRKFGSAEFNGKELPEFTFNFKSKRGVIARVFNYILGRGNEFKVSNVRFVRADGVEESIPFGVEYGKGGEWVLKMKNKPRTFRPGQYVAHIEMKEGTDTFSETVDFYWGMLVINANQSVYKPGEDMRFDMAALDETGDTICDAELTLTITRPLGSVDVVPVEQSGLCGDNNVIDVADYSAHFSGAEAGVYRIDLAQRSEGIVVHRVFDTVLVEAISPFVIRREGATRIYPVASYAMTLKVTAANDFNGDFIESMPKDFVLLDDGGGEVRMYGSAKNLAWPLKLKAGESTEFTYVYDAPDISPYLYMLGPAEIRAGTGDPFSEGRQWKLASDATGNMLLYWDQTFIPTGWTCVSCLPADVFYQRFIMGSSTAGLNGGSATVTHTATGAVAASAGTQAIDTNNQATPTVGHTHGLTPVIGSTSTLPRYRQLAVIQYNSTGQPPLIPAGAIALFDAAVPSGWTTYSAQDNYFVRGESTSTVGTTGGSNTHIHSISGPTDASAGTLNARNPGTSVTVAAASHTHSLTANTGAVSNVPPHIGTIFGKITATSTAPDGMIAMWTGDPGTGWGTVSSTSEPFLNRFAQASTTYGSTGGASTHTHADVTGITAIATTNTVTRDSTPANGNVASQNHTHSVSVTAFSTSNHTPPYRTAVFAKRMGGDTPTTTIEKLFDGEKTATSTPWFEIIGNDPDGSDTLVYQFQWDDDSDLDSSPLGDRTSDDESGCSPNCFSNMVSGGDLSPFNDNERIRFKIQTPLVSGTTYYARARAQSTATSTWGAWATTTSFTYTAGVDPSQWMQTEDAQFDMNTLSGVETYGSNSARLSLADPVEAMTVYGEGTVQTPRYRIWDGSAWSAESSAQSVGGIIQWVVTKAAPTRDEYIAGTQDTLSDINVQVFDGTIDTWGDLQEVTTGVSNTQRRGFDIAYETSSGDALVVYCDGDADPSYYVWNGSIWTGPSPINLASTNNCEWVKLASDPISDEIILVSRDTAAGTNDYEAQVWDGGAWGNSKVLGGMTDIAHEGIAIEYEDSGNQAVLVVSNNGTAGFSWSSWDGTQWGITATQTLGDDFEWGRLRRDDGTDAMSLCYIDQDADIGVLPWDGNAWPTWSAATYERTQNGNANTSRAVDCAYETTAGRDGYLMLTYASSTFGGYQYNDGSTWSVHSLLSTVEDSWTVNTIRTGEGDLLTFFHDDVNSRYDFSDWNGSAWSARTAHESTPSATTSPFYQPVDTAPKQFVSGSGTMITRVIDFDEVPGRQTWGDLLFSTTEPTGTDVIVQVMYETGGSCSTLIPNGDLSGNAAGFDTSLSPVNLSLLSTSTYNRICLKATLSSSNQSVPTLDEWTLTWERQPFLTQDHYRWYVNAAVLTPTDLWPSGGTDLPQDTAISTSYAPPGYGDTLRLRMTLLDENVALSAGELSLTLQYAVGATCSADLTWLDVGDIGSTTAAWRGYDNGGLSDGTTLASNLITEGDVVATYEEQNDTSTNPNGASVGQDSEWDFVLQHNASSSIPYCFRAVTSNGVTLDGYDQYPALTTNNEPLAPTLDRTFDNELSASTSPWFDFDTEDPEGNEITYQIQIDDDYAFGSPAISMDSFTNQNEFNNIVTPADKDPFNSGQMIRFIPTSSLTDGTTYYWRVRAKDRNNSKDWSAWSDIYSVGIDTSVTVSTWRQTTRYQFDTDTLEDAETNGSDQVVITSPFVNATTTSSTIDYDWKSEANSWGSVWWTDTETSSDILYHLEYFTSTSSWALIPDVDLSGNAVGYDTSPLSLLGLSPTLYNQIRLRADMTHLGASPILSDWRVEWAFAVSQPTQSAPFDNEKVGTTTPSFQFISSDPQDDDLIYEVSISGTTDFAASTTRNSLDHSSSFTSVASSTDTSPFEHNTTIQFKVQPADVLTNGNTYWWRVRARDPAGGNAWSAWSDSHSLTVDTSVIVGTWFQTTDSQFSTDSLDDTEVTGSGGARISSTIREAFTAYSEGVVQTPRFRIWNGTTWGTEQSALTVGDTIRFVEVDAAPTRDEYIIATQGATGGVDAQVLNGTTDVAGNKVRFVTAVADLTQRGMDVAYETLSGDAMVVSCSGTEAVYRIWDGASWSATSSIALATSGNCEWIQLASDPVSDEIILLARDATTGAIDYEAQVWDGGTWGDSYVIGGQQVTINNEGMAVEYEESGDQAIVAVSNGTANSFVWTYWDGASWAATTTFALAGDFAGGRLQRDLGSDKLALCYIDVNADIGYVEWSGSGWTGAANTFEISGNSANGRPVTCEYEVNGSRDGYLMIPSSDTTQSEYWVWDGGTLTGPGLLSSVPDSWELRSARTGDGNILVVAYNDGDTDYDFSYWNGSQWSTIQILETSSIATVVPATVPIDIVARRFPTITTGSLTTTSADFNDGIGPKWGSVSWTDSTPGSSDILYQIEYFTSTSSWALIPDLALQYNSVGTSTGPIDITNLNTTTYNQLRLKANLACAGVNCPTLTDWTLAWDEGVHVAGTAKQFDQSTNLTSGTVYVAVNGVLQMGRTATIAAGAWDIANVTAFAGDIITVWIASAGDTGEAVAITKYDGTGDISGMKLFERHLALGSDENPTLTNANVSAYDNSVSGNEDIFYNVDAGNDLTLCSATGCYDARLLINSGTTYQPDSASSGNVDVRHLQIDGVLQPDANTLYVSGSWDNNGTFTASSSVIVFTATSTTETIDSTGSLSDAFFAVTFGTSDNATWNLASVLNASSTLSLNDGTLSAGIYAINLSGNLSVGANGAFTKGTASTTFMGSSAATWTDASALKQDFGIVVVDGAAKSVSFGSNVKATDVWIGANDTLSAGTNYNISVLGDWNNSGTFTAQSGTVTFASTGVGETITPGTSSFYNLIFDGVGGNWAFNSQTATATNDFTITNGTVTLASGTTTIGGSFAVTNGDFMHNNGVVLFNGSAAETIAPAAYSFYDLAFNGSGSWTFPNGNATSSRHTFITTGTLTAPSNTFAIGGSFARNGGTFTHNSGTLKFTASSAQTLRLNNSDTSHLYFSGSGSWSFVDTNATSTGTVRVDQGTLTLPSGTFAVGGSWLISSSGAFTHNSGTVKFNSIDTGETITPNGSWFANLLFNAAGGGWTIAQNATSTASTTISNASSFTVSSGVTLSVSGGFTNSVGGAATTWTGSTLYLDSGNAYSLNTKANTGDTYETLAIAANTDVKMWNSSASTHVVNASGSLYSQDHGAVDGDLYIWGQYVSTQNEYWSYATDFDGTSLGGSPRQVDVRVADTSSISYSTGTLQILGTALATTTIANQGSGTYGFAVTGGTVNAQYYSVRNTDSTGLSISGTPTITSLADGDFELGVNAGSMLTIASTAINQNPALQIERVQFATSTGISSGYNVTESGAPTSYWWFRNTYGNYDGEDYDNDPAGSPGYIRFDDSGLTINVEGRVFSDHGSTAIGAPCDGSTNNVRILVSGLSTSTYSGSCVLATGFYSIPVTFTGDVVLTAYLDGTSKKAVTVTQTPTTDITNLDLYENALVVRHEDTAPLTIDDLAVWDSDDDSDIFFDATSGSPDTLSVQPERELFVWGAKTFAPGGNMTLESGGSGNARDGRLELGAASTFTGVTTESYSLGGGLTVPTGATFTSASTTITFVATTTGKSINAPGVTLYDVTFNGIGGGWTLDNTSTTTILGAMTVTAGTVSGTGNISTRSGGPTGNGVIAMTGGTFELRSTGNFGGSNEWQFYNLTIGGPTSGVVTNTGSATTTISNVLRLSSNGTLNAGSAPWILTGSGTPFAIVAGGTFSVGTAPFYYRAASATNVADTTYANLTLAPSGAGSPTYTLLGGSFTTTDLTIGSGFPVLVNINTNDPSITVNGNLLISASTTLIASNVGALNVRGSWTNNSTFTHSNGTVSFTSTDTGETIAASSSPFYNLTFNNAGGGWTMGNATSTNNTTLTAASSFTLSPNATLSVGGTFTNSVGGAATDWTNSTLTLTSGTSFALNTKSNTGDTYGTLALTSNTDVSMWNSSATITTVHSTGSLYSQDHAGVDGDLYIWGEYTKSSGSDYWSYATDFDGTSLGGSSRQVDVRIASSSTISRSGGVLDIIGGSLATTTIAVQGTGEYAFALTGGTLNAQYYSLRNTDLNGLSLSGTPTISSLSNGDFELSREGGSMITVTSTVIDANPLEIFTNNSFGTSTGILSGSNVTETGTPASYWKFNLHYGNYDGESFDTDPGGDPGQIRWDDSDTGILITGTVYSGEGSGVSGVCDDATQVVSLAVQGVVTHTADCASLDGSFSLVDVVFNPGDTLTLFLDTNGGTKAANITIDAVDDIAGMDLYEHRVIVRHEDTAPLTIADMIQYDSDQDTDIPFDAEDAATDTLIVQPEHKLIVWTDKTFAPAGNVTILSGGSGNSWDGSLQLFGTSTFSGAGSQTHTIGGNFTVNANAVFTPANSTVTFAATTTGKTITPNGSSFYNVTFNGNGGNWAFAGGTATSTNDFTITLGTVTLPTATTTVGGSFQNTGGTFMHNNGVLLLNATASGKMVRLGGSNAYILTFNGSGGAWSFADTNATSSLNVIITAGTVTAPSGTLAVGGSFMNAGTFTHNSGILRFTSTSAGKTITAGGSNFYNVLFNGAGGSWNFTDTNATTTNDFTIAAGTSTLPIGVLAIGGSFDIQDRFAHNSGTVKFNASATGKTITASTSPFYNLEFNSGSGGWTIGSATSTASTTLTSANAFTLSSGATLSVGGVFTNSVGGAATTWTNSTLTLTSGTAYALNAKATTGDTYGTLAVTANTDVSMWNSSAATTTVNASGSLYSQDHAAVDGSLYIFGEYVRSSGAEYWSYATDFDGTALGGSSRQVSVRVATSSSVTLSGGTLDIVGSASATTTIQASGTTGFGFALSGGTLNASYYRFTQLDASGLSISGTPTISSLSHGDLELTSDGGTLMTVAGSAIDANASLSITDLRFATTTGVNSGTNVTRTGSPITAWYFSNEYGVLAGENYDSDGGDACGFIRWSDSTCLFVSQEHFKWREDDGGEGAPNSEWYNASWTKRKRIAISNPNATALTNIPVRLDVLYDSDMQADFDDLRFTNSSGTTSLDFWVESTVNSASSTVWVEVPSLSSSGSTIIYAYYGNGAAASASVGTTTFSFFDDFEDDNITEYSGNTSLFDTSTSFNYTHTYGLDAGVEFGNKTTTGLYRTGSLLAQNQTIRFYQYVDTASVDPSEPCTLFAVQGSAQNYAVCLDEDPTERVSIAENVTSDDDSGTVLNSTAVTYSTGWYQVEIDWLSSNAINVTVYDEAGDVFATVSTSDSSYTSGGVGFSYWFMYGGWDFYSARPYAAIEPTYVFGIEQGKDGATARAAEDTTFTTRTLGDVLRLRFSIQNTAATIYSRLFRLQFAQKGASLNCESVPYVSYSDVPVYGSCGSSHACMSTSTYFVNGASTSPLLSYPANFNFSAGYMVEDPSNQTASSSISSNAATEVEYALALTDFASEDSYCFRASNGGLDLDNYTHVAELGLSFAPDISNFSLNDGEDIALTEGSTTTVSAVATVTDRNGYADIISATSTIYRSGVGPSCSADDNNCYPAPTCAFSACSGNSCTLTCTAQVQYVADPTDTGSVYELENWLARVQIEDTQGLMDVQTAGADLLTLYALSVTPSLDFGSLYVGEDTGTVNATSTIANTGNANIDIQVAGTNLTGGASSIPVGEQKFATTTFAYGGCAICDYLSGSATDVEVDLPKPTATTSSVTDDVYWGINIPSGTGATTFTGTNTFWAVSD